MTTLLKMQADALADMEILKRFVASVPTLAGMKWEAPRTSESPKDIFDIPSSFYNTSQGNNSGRRLDRKAINKTIKAIHSGFAKERYLAPAGQLGKPVSTPDYQLTFEGHQVYFQYDNFDRSYIQLHILH